MNNNRQMTYHPSKPKSACRQLVFIQLLLFVPFLSAGCNSVSPKQYVNPKLGVQLEKADNWQAEYSERNGLLTLRASKGTLRKRSAQIEIIGNSCYYNPALEQSTLDRDLERIRNLYGLDSVDIIQEPIKTETKDYKVLKAVIAIPTEVMRNSNDLQVRNQGHDVMQIIDVYAIWDRGYKLLAYIYEGEDETLNGEAKEIVSSVRSTCPNE